MKNEDAGMKALLEVLKDRPELVHALVFDHEKVKSLLTSKAAQKLTEGLSAGTMLPMSAPGAGGATPALFCSRTLLSTALMPWLAGQVKNDCLKSTYLACKPPPPTS